MQILLWLDQLVLRGRQVLLARLGRRGFKEYKASREYRVILDP